MASGYTNGIVGNILSVNGFTLAYDAENGQTSVTEQPALGGGQEVYLYDGNDQRVEKIGMGGNTIYVYDAFGQLAAEYNTFVGSFACATCYVTIDQLGSVRMVTDQKGNVVGRHDYLPFGEETTGATSDVGQRFTGQQRDSGTGLDYFNARYYTAVLGRFNSPDPENAGAYVHDPQTWNAYSYVRNSPLVLTDIDGMDPGDGGMPVVTTPPVTVTATPDPVVPDPTATGTLGTVGIVYTPASGTPVFKVTAKKPKALPVSPAPNPVQVAFGETGGLYPLAKKGTPDKTSIYKETSWDPASYTQLQLARRNIADVSKRNHTVHLKQAGSDPISKMVWAICEWAVGSSDGGMQGNYFFIRQDGIGDQRPKPIAGYGQGDPLVSYGPFRNVGGGDVPGGNATYIDIYTH